MELYDKASRGTWGSLGLLYRKLRPGSKAKLVSLGAFLTIIAVAIDPFAQAAVSQQSCWRPSTGIASTPRSNNYSSETENFLFDSSMQLASYLGVLDPPVNSSVSISASCPTGNCTFPDFNSLSMCAQTWDITNHIQRIKTNFHPLYYLSSTNSLTVPGGGFNLSYVAVPGTAFDHDSDGSPWSRTSLLDVLLLSMIRDNSTDCTEPCVHSDVFSANMRPTAFRFSLFPCVQTFAANVTHGKYRESVQHEQYLHHIGGGWYQQALSHAMAGNSSSSPRDCKSTEKATETNTIRVYAPNVQTRDFFEIGFTPRWFEDQYLEGWYPPECVFELAGAYDLAEFIGRTFFTSATYNYPLTAWQNKLWRNGTTTKELVEDFANGLATALGAQLRKSATGPGMLQEARGEALIMHVCFRVEWGHLAFLATFLVLGALFLATVVVVNNRSRFHVDWKSSTLALVFLSIVGSTRPLSKTVMVPDASEESIKKEAKSLQVSLIDTTGDWQLRARQKG